MKNTEIITKTHLFIALNKAEEKYNTKINEKNNEIKESKKLIAKAINLKKSNNDLLEDGSVSTEDIVNSISTITTGFAHQNVSFTPNDLLINKTALDGDGNIVNGKMLDRRLLNIRIGSDTYSAEHFDNVHPEYPSWKSNYLSYYDGRISMRVPDGYYKDDSSNGGTAQYVYSESINFGNATAKDVVKGKTFTSKDGLIIQGGIDVMRYLTDAVGYNPIGGNLHVKITPGAYITLNPAFPQITTPEIVLKNSHLFGNYDLPDTDVTIQSDKLVLAPKSLNKFVNKDSTISINTTGINADNIAVGKVINIGNKSITGTYTGLGNAKVNNVVQGFTFSNSTESNIEGTIVNHGDTISNIETSLDTDRLSISIDNGYYNAVSPNKPKGYIQFDYLSSLFNIDYTNIPNTTTIFGKTGKLQVFDNTSSNVDSILEYNSGIGANVPNGVYKNSQLIIPKEKLRDMVNYDYILSEYTLFGKKGNISNSMVGDSNKRYKLQGYMNSTTEYGNTYDISVNENCYLKNITKFYIPFPNLLPGNIKSGVNVNGVIGTYTGFSDTEMIDGIGNYKYIYDFSFPISILEYDFGYIDTFKIHGIYNGELDLNITGMTNSGEKFALSGRNVEYLKKKSFLLKITNDNNRYTYTRVIKPNDTTTVYLGEDKVILTRNGSRVNVEVIPYTAYKAYRLSIYLVGFVEATAFQNSSNND